MFVLNYNFSNFGSLKSTETGYAPNWSTEGAPDFSNFGSLKSTETALVTQRDV